MGELVIAPFPDHGVRMSKKRFASHPAVRRSGRWVEQQIRAGMPASVDENGQRVIRLEAIAWLAERGKTRRLAEPDVALVKHLDAWRARAADGRAPSTVLGWETLREIAAAQPQSIAALRVVKGVGPSFVARYGASIATVLGVSPEDAEEELAHQQEPPPPPPPPPPECRLAAKPSLPPETLHGLRIGGAAQMLDAPPSTIRSWERRFGFPVATRTPSGQRRYDLATVEALRDALEEAGGEITAAIELAKRRLAEDVAEAKATDHREHRLSALEKRVAELEGQLRELDHDPLPAA